MNTFRCRISTELREWRSGYWGSIPGRGGIDSSFFITSRPALGPTHTLSSGYRGLFPRGQSGPDVKLTTHVHLMPRLIMVELTMSCLPKTYNLFSSPSRFAYSFCCLPGPRTPPIGFSRLLPSPHFSLPLFVLSRPISGRSLNQVCYARPTPLTAYFLLVSCLTYFYTLKKEAECSPETSFNFYRTTLRHFPFKCIVCGTELTVIFSEVGNAALWVMNCAALPQQHVVRRAFQAP
jgi:hypothetical protein